MALEEQKLKAVKKFLKQNDGSLLVLGKHLKRYKGAHRIDIGPEQFDGLSSVLGIDEKDKELLEELDTFTTMYVDVYGMSEPNPMTSTLYTSEQGNPFPTMRKRGATISTSIDVLEQKLNKKYDGHPSCVPNAFDRIADHGLNYMISYDQKKNFFTFTLYQPISHDKNNGVHAKQVLGQFSHKRLKDGLRQINRSGVSDVTLDLLVAGLKSSAAVPKDRGDGRPYALPGESTPDRNPAVEQGILELYYLGASNDLTVGALHAGYKVPYIKNDLPMRSLAPKDQKPLQNVLSGLLDNAKS